MSKRVTSCVTAAGLLATAVMLGTNSTTLAAGDCLTGPNRPLAQGGHWYYRFDHANNRKCWYLAEPGGQAPTAEAPEPQPSPQAPLQPTLGAFFSSLTAGLTGTQPDPTTGDARIMQAARPDDIKTDLALPARQSRMARRPDSSAALAAKPQRPARARPPAEHADERPAASINQDQRDALFAEFLRWKGRQ
jgi:hypothetical protein